MGGLVLGILKVIDANRALHPFKGVGGGVAGNRAMGGGWRQGGASPRGAGFGASRPLSLGPAPAHFTRIVY